MNNTDDNKNLIYFLIASMVLLFGYQYFIAGPQQKKAQAQQAAAASASAAASSSAVAAGLPAPGTVAVMTREQALGQSPRVTIATPSLKGSLSLKGALLDDLYLIKYDQTTDKKNDPVELLRPAGSDRAYYVQSGYRAQNVPGVPDQNTPWTLASGDVLAPGKPVVLTYDNGAGLVFTRTLAVDENYMFTQVDQIANNGAAPVSLEPFAAVVRLEIPAEAAKAGVVHEGLVATYPNAIKDGKVDHYITTSLKYKDLAKDPQKKNVTSKASIGGWFGITDKYWMAAVIPDQKQSVSFTALADTGGAKPVFRTGYIDNQVTIAPGQTWQAQSRIFAGAKVNSQLQAYEKSLAIPRFHWAVDWGMLSMITFPMYWLLDKLYAMIGNFGFSILALTVIVKAVFYPLAHRAYESMTKMKQVQDRLKPKLDKIKQKYPEDMQKQQEATMQLYQEEKVNPMAGLGGCLPMMLQLPVFWGLYKVLQLAIEMRHAPFFGWIKDLSAPDPSSIINLFGLLPFTPATVPVIGSFLAGPAHIGIVAILYGCSMWLSQQMTPTSGVDPMQKRMLSLMPIFLTLFMAQVAVGLIIYWIWSNALTILQQYSIMHRLKVENPIDTAIAKVREQLDKKKAA